MTDVAAVGRSIESLPLAGSCFGFAVHGAFPFSYLRRGGGIRLDVHVTDDQPPEPPSSPLLEWVARPNNPFSARLYPSASGYDIWVDGVGWYRVDPSAQQVYIASDLPYPRIEAGLWGIPAGVCIVRRGDLTLHAAAVEIDGRALVLAAPSRFGKTTLASAFLARGCRLLSEDLTCCTLSPVPAVVPGPALLRVRRDSYERLEFPGTRAVFETDDRLYLALDEETRGSGDPVPLFGIAFLHTASHVQVRRLDLASALPDLWTLSFRFPTDPDRARCFGGLAELASRVLVWEVSRPLDFERTDHVVDRLLAMCRS